ncbi:MAG: hypothetical protein P8Z35_01050 [Ignavibacteriaceae bacterium]
MNTIKSTNHDEMIPLKFYLSQNYPNPFIEKTTLKYCVAYKTVVEIKVFDSEDNFIVTLLKMEQEAGTYEIEFDGADLPGELYYCRINAGSYNAVKKMILLK